MYRMEGFAFSRIAHMLPDQREGPSVVEQPSMTATLANSIQLSHGCQYLLVPTLKVELETVILGGDAHAIKEARLQLGCIREIHLQIGSISFPISMAVPSHIVKLSRLRTNRLARPLRLRCLSSAVWPRGTTPLRRGPVHRHVSHESRVDPNESDLSHSPALNGLQYIAFLGWVDSLEMSRLGCLIGGADGSGIFIPSSPGDRLALFNLRRCYVSFPSTKKLDRSIITAMVSIIHLFCTLYTNSRSTNYIQTTHCDLQGSPTPHPLPSLYFQTVYVSAIQNVPVTKKGRRSGHDSQSWPPPEEEKNTSVSTAEMKVIPSWIESRNKWHMEQHETSMKLWRSSGGVNSNERQRARFPKYLRVKRRSLVQNYCHDCQATALGRKIDRPSSQSQTIVNQVLVAVPRNCTSVFQPGDVPFQASEEGGKKVAAILRRNHSSEGSSCPSGTFQEQEGARRAWSDALTKALTHIHLGSWSRKKQEENFPRPKQRIMLRDLQLQAYRSGARGRQSTAPLMA
ncbi:hypothetical protein HD554DRAFT_2041521 [Boletus coccyginus]|nr:hypothetical protein HD554DRAFT_2041521 [Boletus coccyginus]